VICDIIFFHDPSVLLVGPPSALQSQSDGIAKQETRKAPLPMKVLLVCSLLRSPGAVFSVSGNHPEKEVSTRILHRSVVRKQTATPPLSHRDGFWIGSLPGYPDHEP
jgi:hypothetical protein